MENKLETTCRSCKKVYAQTQKIQKGIRSRSYDVCPYCNKLNDSSIEVEYTNKRKEVK